MHILCTCTRIIHTHMQGAYYVATRLETFDQPFRMVYVTAVFAVLTELSLLLCCCIDPGRVQKVCVPGFHLTSCRPLELSSANTALCPF